MHAVGRATATLHAHAETWSLPPGTALTRFDDPLFDCPNNFDLDHPELTAERRGVIDETLRRCSEQFAVTWPSSRGAPRVIHGDLHNGNLRWHKGQLAVFDFDDSGIGHPMQDLAISAYYLRDDYRLEAALLDGYQSARPLPPFTAEEFEAHVAARNLILLNDLLTITTADLRAIIPRYTHNTVTKLRHWLDTGVYRHEVSGLRTK
jgi:Ser/Thr protein kinase RdoA (MazF antagonist)